MHKPLQNQKVAILAASGVTETHMTEIQKNLMKTGAFARIISVDHALLNSWNGSGWGVNFAVDAALSTALGVDYDMLIIPGGTRSTEKLMRTAHTKRFLDSFMRLQKPICVVEDGAELLDSCGIDRKSENIAVIDENEMSVMVTHFIESAQPDMAAAA
ncbi:MAG: DJ-1/PfpI family protein [Rhodospirillales bacterium]|nr:DJ-1/PfpI family protein [Rhodospirillales bacterium]MCB9965897.1 DJ-1/PfpI family protein [Rhodospirillales bacterium]